MKIASRFKFQLSAEVITVISQGALIVLLGNLLRPDEYGTLFLVISILGTVEIFSRFGIAESAARYISNYKETDPTQIAGILRFSFSLNIVLLAIVSGVYLLSIDQVVSLTAESDLRPILFVGVFYIIFSTLRMYPRRVLQGFEAIKHSAALQVLNYVSRLFFAVLLILLGYGVLGALLGYILAFILTSIFGLTYVFVRYYNPTNSSALEKGLRRRIAEYSVPITVTNSAVVTDQRVDILLLGFFAGPTAVAFYTLGKQISGFIQAPMNALGFTISPTFEAQKAGGNVEIAAALYENSLQYGLVIYIPAAAGLALVAEPFIYHIFGSEYLDAVVILQILSVYVILQALVKITSQGLDFLGRAKDRAFVRGITSALNVILNIVFIPRFGAVGAAAATVISFSIYTVANIYIMNSELNLRVRWILRQMFISILVTVIMCIPVYAILETASGFATLLAAILVGVLIWLVLVTVLEVIDVYQLAKMAIT